MYYFDNKKMTAENDGYFYFFKKAKEVEPYFSSKLCVYHEKNNNRAEFINISY
jgi:hypothetical protein